MNGDSDFWQKVQEQMVAEDIPEEWRFEMITGQGSARVGNFSADW